MNNRILVLVFTILFATPMIAEDNPSGCKPGYLEMAALLSEIRTLDMAATGAGWVALLTTAFGATIGSRAAGFVAIGPLSLGGVLMYRASNSRASLRSLLQGMEETANHTKQKESKS